MIFEKERHTFWMDDPSILYKNKKYIDFIPSIDMTRVEQLNSITRLSLYFATLIVMFQKNAKWLYLPIIIIMASVVLYNVHYSDNDSRQKEVMRLLKHREEAGDKEKAYEERLYNLKDPDKEFFPAFETDPNAPKIQSGFYDSDGNLMLGDKYNPPKYSLKNPKSLYTFDELVQYDKASCRRPTQDNPLMNSLVDHYGTGDHPSACNANDDDIREEIEVNFNKDLYRDVEDLWNKKNSQRQFYTTPSTSIPNNQKEFAEWLYKVPFTCKENNENCLRYEDLRFKKQHVHY